MAQSVQMLRWLRSLLHLRKGVGFQFVQLSLVVRTGVAGNFHAATKVCPAALGIELSLFTETLPDRTSACVSDHS